MGRLLDYVVYSLLVGLADRFSTELCLGRGLAELNMLAFNPIFPVYQFAVFFSSLCFIDFLCDVFGACGRLKRYPIMSFMAVASGIFFHNLAQLILCGGMV